MKRLGPLAEQILGICVLTGRPKSVRTLAGDIRLNVSTVRSACDALERAGLIEATYVDVRGRTVRHFVPTPAGIEADRDLLAIDDEKTLK